MPQFQKRLLFHHHVGVGEGRAGAADLVFCHHSREGPGWAGSTPGLSCSRVGAPVKGLAQVSWGATGSDLRGDWLVTWTLTPTTAAHLPTAGLGMQDRKQLHRGPGALVRVGSRPWWSSPGPVSGHCGGLGVGVGGWHLGLVTPAHEEHQGPGCDLPADGLRFCTTWQPASPPSAVGGHLAQGQS